VSSGIKAEKRGLYSCLWHANPIAGVLHKAKIEFRIVQQYFTRCHPFATLETSNKFAQPTIPDQEIQSKH
jgi:hypothetical protein